MNLKELKTIKRNFVKELARADRGQKTSLRYINHTIPSSPLVNEEEIFQVIVIGGTVSKNALVKLQNGKITILKKAQKKQPQFKTKEDVFKFIQKNLAKNIRVLSLNFAYAMKPVFEKGKLDGVLFGGSKENTFKGLIGKKVAAELEKCLGRKIRISTANDTVCLLLSGLTKYPFNQIAAGVFGTGLNFAIFKNENILVNLESASFDKFKLSPEAIIINKESEHVGRGLFEKETAGAYLYKHFNLILRKKKIKYKLLRSTQQLKEIADKNIPKVSPIAKDILERSAALVACQIAGICEFQGKDLIFVMEGSLFWQTQKPQIEKYLKKLSPKYKVKFQKIEDSEILGAAKLVS